MANLSHAGRIAGAVASLAVFGAAHSVQAQQYPADPAPGSAALIAQQRAPLDKLTPVTNATLLNPSENDWLMWRRTYDGWGYSPLRQITKANVKTLQVAWTWSLTAGPTQTTPLVHDGVMFVQNFGDSVDALDAVNGNLLWRYTHRLARGVSPTNKRMIAIHGENILITTSDKHLVALNMRTGKVAWDHLDASDGVFNSGPMVVNDYVFTATTGCGRSRCSIIGHDVADGKELWRFYTVAAPGEPGGDTWNDLPLEKRYGGSSWTSGSYDPKLDILYWGTGQPYDWYSLARGTMPLKAGANNDALYTNNTLAFKPGTGQLVWHFSHMPNDSWDMDYTYERELIDLPVKGKLKRLSITTGKTGILEALDAQTGAFAFAKDLGVQNLVQSIDPVTGAKTYNPAAAPPMGVQTVICPTPSGGRTTHASAYDPSTRLLYIGLVENCGDRTVLQTEDGGIGAERIKTKAREGSDGNVGRLDAVDMVTHKTVWSKRERAPRTSAVLATAGGVLFQGMLDRYFKANDAATGEDLWKIRLNDVPNSTPVTYSVGGKQYVAVLTGAGSPWTQVWNNLVPEIRNPPSGGATLWVFALPDR